MSGTNKSDGATESDVFRHRSDRARPSAPRRADAARRQAQDEDEAVLAADSGPGVGIYSSHVNDNIGFTWQDNDALIAQDDAIRAAAAK